MTNLSQDFLNTIPQLTGNPPAVDVDTLPDDPRELFSKWFQEAVDGGVPEPKAVTLATADAEGRPDARIVEIFTVDENGWSIATGANSSKAAQLTANPNAALNFWWQPHVRAIRVRGAAHPVPLGEGGQIWQIQPTRVEFWQSNQERENLSIRYDKTDEGWDRSVYS